MKFGYARVSTQDQNLDLQVQALKEAGCERIYEDRMTGTRADRPGLMELLSQLRESDMLVTWKLDRIGRGLKDLVDLIGDMEQRGVQFQSLTEAINTSTPSGRMIFHVIGAMAQMERELIVERTQAGLRAARKRGIVGGRKRKMTPTKVQSAKQLLMIGTPPREVASSLGVSLPTLYRWVPASLKSSQ